MKSQLSSKLSSKHTYFDTCRNILKKSHHSKQRKWIEIYQITFNSFVKRYSLLCVSQSPYDISLRSGWKKKTTTQYSIGPCCSHNRPEYSHKSQTFIYPSPAFHPAHTSHNHPFQTIQIEFRCGWEAWAKEAYRYTQSIGTIHNTGCDTWARHICRTTFLYEYVTRSDRSSKNKCYRLTAGESRLG